MRTTARSAPPESSASPPGAQRTQVIAEACACSTQRSSVCAWSPAPNSITCLNDGFNGNNVTISRGNDRVAEHTLLRSDYKLSDYFCLKANTEHTLRVGDADGEYLEFIHWTLLACQEETAFLSGGAELEGTRFHTPAACSVLPAPAPGIARLLDEFGLAIVDFIALIRSLAGEMTILLIEHNINVVMQTADAITVLNSGQVLAEGTPNEIRANAAVQAAYLGTG